MPDPAGTHVVPRRSEDEINEIAVGIVQNRIYWPPNGEALEASFGAMMMLAFPEWDRADIDQVGWVYGHEDKAGPLCVNGYPMFLSMKLVHVDDVPLVLERYRAKYAALQAG